MSSSLLELKEALRAFSPKTIFDARRNLRAGHLVNIGSKKHDKFGTPISVEATANFNLTDDALEVTRTNSDGTWNIEVRPNGMSAPTISRSLTTERSVRIHFEAKIDGAEHNIRCVSLDANTRDWIENRLFHVREREWKNFSAELNAPSNLDILVRLQDELEHPPRGTLYIRNIVVTQPES